MNRTKSLAILALCAVASALIVTAIRSKPNGSSTRDLPAASRADSHQPGRRFHIINLSLGRTGSASIAGLFDRYRSAHEFMLIPTLTHILDWREGKLSDEALDAFLLERDNRFRYEVDSTTVLHLAQDRLLVLFPDAKFLLAVRDGGDWLVSTLDLMTYLYLTCENQKQFSDFRCSELISQTSRLSRLITPHFKEEYYRDIENLGTNITPILPDIAAFWGNWTLTTLRNLGQLPRERVLILRTRNIDDSLDGLAALAGIDKSQLNLERHHINRDRKIHDFAALIGKDRIAGAFQPWQDKVDARLKELGVK